jgi:hypothetical protein
VHIVLCDTWRITIAYFNMKLGVSFLLRCKHVHDDIPQRVHPVLAFASLEVMLNHFSSAAPTAAYPAELRVLYFVSADSNEIQRIFHCYLVLLL